MNRAEENRRIDRRTFLKAGAIGAAAVSTGSGALAADAETAALPAAAYRTLGRTGLKLSSIGIGTFRTTEPAVMRQAFDRGVNFLDTARSYHDGLGEGYVGEALEGYRDRVTVSTKIVRGSKETMVKDIDTSLAKLGTDHVDILMLHHIERREEVLDETARAVLVEAKRQGKARFLGVSTHKNEVEVLDAMLEDPDRIYDAAMVVYNFKSSGALEAALGRATEAGIGIVAMKTQAGGYKTEELGEISPHQAALKWVLRNPNVHSTVPSMVNLDQIKENAAVLHMDVKLSRAERQVLDRYADAIAPYYCHRCGACEATCPYGVDIPTINRCLMYAEGYGDIALAKATHAELAPDRSAAVCRDCTTCVARCARALTVPEQMRRAQALLA